MENQENTAKIGQIILQAVDNVKLGKHKLASFLKGSKAKSIAPIAHKNIYGRLLWYDIPTIEGFIEQLETLQLIKRDQVDIFLSYYVLTETGRKAIQEHREIPLQVINKHKPIRFGASEKETLNMIKQGKTINEIAQARNLAKSTIYTHLLRLIITRHLSSNEVISEEVIKQISEVIGRLKDIPSVKELKELAPNISYEEIRCVLADMKRGKPDELD